MKKKKVEVENRKDMKCSHYYAHKNHKKKAIKHRSATVTLILIVKAENKENKIHLDHPPHPPPFSHTHTHTHLP